MKRCLRCDARFSGSSWSCPECGATPGASGDIVVFAPELAAENDGFSADYFARLARLEAKNFWFRSRNRLIAWALGKYFARAQSFMEIGCGNGYVLSGMAERFPQVSLSGSEVFIEGLEFARQRVPRATLFQMDALRIPFDSEFDVIGAFDVVEHIADDDAVLREMFRACRPGGGALLTVPLHPFLWSAADTYAHHKRRYRRGELQSKAAAAGFRVLRTTGFVTLLLPMLLALRSRQKDLATFDPTKGLDLNPLANGVLESVMTVERQAIRAGVSMPAGGSQLLVLRKEA